MPDDFFDYLVATGQLDDFLGLKEDYSYNEDDEETDEDIEDEEEDNE